MYKVIGANKIEYGPVDAAQVRQWIAEGRLVADSLIRTVEQTSWQPLSSLPEFAASFNAAPPVFPTTPPPLTPPPTPATPGLMSPINDPRAYALAEVNGPAIGLIVTAVLGFLIGGGGLISNAGRALHHGMRLGQQFPTPFGGGGFGPGGDLPPEFQRFMDLFLLPVGIGTGLVHLALAGIILYGGIKMMRLENHGLAVSAAVIALIPCISPCCCFGLPIGIWALIVLNRPEIKSQFK